MENKNSSEARKAYQLIKENGGVTISLGGDQPTEGFAYAPSKETEASIPNEEFTPQFLEDFYAKNADLLSQPGNHLGGWVENGRTYLDVSCVGEPSAKTLDAAQKASQLGVFDLRTFCTITTGTIENGVYTRTDEATSLFDKYQRENSPAINAGSNAGIPKISSSESAGTGTAYISRFGKGIVFTCREAFQKVLRGISWVKAKPETALV